MTKIEITALKFENGNILLGYSMHNDKYCMKTSDGIFAYNKKEMIELGYLTIRGE